MADVPAKVVLMTWPSPATIRGWGRYATVTRWRLEVLPPNGQAARALEADPPDGVIAYLGDDWFNDWAGRQALPIVNHSSALDLSSVPRVSVDDQAAGRLAAEHLLGLGHRSLAYVGYPGPFYSRERLIGFRQRADDAGVEVAELSVTVALTPVARQRSRDLHVQMVRFLADLPKPVGVFACNDPLGLWVVDAAADAGRLVPEDTAVLGMDDDPLCQLSDPPLSSIASPFERVAYEAAGMLDALMAGKPLKVRDLRIAPQHIISRRSTEMLAIADRQLAAAVRYLHDHSGSMVHMDDVARVAGVNRRTLEKRFQQTFGRSPLQELQRYRLEAAKRLLANPRLPLSEVALRAGFESQQWFSTLFRRELGETPLQYRRRIR